MQPMNKNGKMIFFYLKIVTQYRSKLTWTVQIFLSWLIVKIKVENIYSKQNFDRGVQNT